MLHDDIDGAGQAAWLSASVNCMKKLPALKSFLEAMQESGHGNYADTRQSTCSKHILYWNKRR